MAFELTVSVGDQPSRTITVDPDNLTLGLLEDIQEAQETGKWKVMNTCLAGFLGLTREEIRSITNKQFREISAALLSATNGEPIPNG